MKKAILLLVFPLVLFPQFAKVGTAGAQFLTIPVGARATGMGEAYIGVCEDATACFWDPADLVRIDKVSVFIGGFQWIAGFQHVNVAFAKRLNPVSVAGGFITVFDSGEMEETTIEEYGTGNYFSYKAYQAGVSYAASLTEKFSFGLNLKVLGEIYGPYSSTIAWAWDVGTIYFTGWKTLRFGMSIFHFGPDIKPSGTYIDWTNGEPGDTMEYSPYPLPITFRVGAAMEVYETENMRVTLAVDGVHPNDNLEGLRIGTEISLMDMLFVRGGYALQKDEQDVSFGMGVKYNIFNIDYSFTNMGALPDCHRMDVSISF